MSRVYNVLTGTARSVPVPSVSVPDDGVWANSEEAPDEELPHEETPEQEAPYIEIGGPSGPIFFSPPSAAVASAIPAPAPSPASPPETRPEAARSYPRLVPATTAPAYLSVRFHEIDRGSRAHGDGPDSSLVTLHHPEHPVSGEYRVLRDEIRKQHPEAGPRVLLFSAAARESGTTTVLLNLAITLAQEDRTKVLILDANLNHPAVASKLGLRTTPGLCEVLAGQTPLAWALQPTPLASLQVLASGECIEPPDATFTRDYPRLLDQLRQWFDWILVDGGLWGDSPEPAATSSLADAVYLVARESDTQSAEFLTARTRVKDGGGRLRGYVVTRV